MGASYSDDYDYLDRAVLYENGQVKHLGGLPGGCHYSSATGINDSGQVVGSCLVGSTDHAFLYENGQMKDLGLLPGGYGSAAFDINGSGQVVGDERTVPVASKNMPSSTRTDR